MNISRTLRAFATITASLIPISCGGGGGAPAGSNSGGTTSQNPAGIYFGSVQSAAAGTLTATAIALDSGEFRYVASNGVQAAGTFLVSGSALAGTGTLFAPAGTVFTGGATSASVTISNGSVTTASRAAGNFSGGGDSGNFNFTYNPIFTRPVSVGTLAGSYHSTATSSGYPVTVAVTTSGLISGFDALGTFTGTISQPSATQNAFRVQVTYVQGGQSPLSFNGLGFLTDGATQNSVFNLQMSSSLRQFATTLVR